MSKQVNATNKHENQNSPCKKVPIALPRVMFIATPVAPSAMSNAGNSLDPLLILRVVYP